MYHLQDSSCGKRNGDLFDALESVKGAVMAIVA
jgi:hypothetical protein